MPSILRDLGRAVRRARKARALTQLDLAERAGLDVSTVARIERGKLDPSASTLFALADALQVEPGQLRR